MKITFFLIPSQSGVAALEGRCTFLSAGRCRWQRRLPRAEETSSKSEASRSDFPFLRPPREDVDDVRRRFSAGLRRRIPPLSFPFLPFPCKSAALLMNGMNFFSPRFLSSCYCLLPREDDLLCDPGSPLCGRKTPLLEAGAAILCLLVLFPFADSSDSDKCLWL